MANVLCRLAITVIVFTVYFIYPIPHTIALRNLLLTILLAISFWQVAKHKATIQFPDFRNTRTPAYLLLTLTVWLFFQTFFISPYPEAALEMLRGDWLVSLAISAIAAASVFATYKAPSHTILAITGSLFFHVAILLGYQIWVWLSTGSFPFGHTPFAQKDYHSMLVTTLTALLVADLLSRTIIQRNILILSWRWIATALVLSCIASITLLARNAVIITALILIGGGLLAVRKRTLSRSNFLSAIISTLILAGIIGWLGLRSDSRWEGFIDAAQSALDTKNNLAWLDAQKYPLPLLKNGSPVEESAYSRLAWFKVGLEQIGRYPLGLGYGHKAFGWAVNRSYGVNTGHESSHSGLIDFTLANGIPGLILWLALSGSLIVVGWQNFRQKNSPTGLMLAFTVIAYLARCLIDGHLSGFRLEMYAFLVGTLLMTQLFETKKCA